MNNIVDARLFKLNDIFLVPVCLLLIFVIAYIVRKKYTGTSKAGYFFPALLLRLVFVFLYAIVVQYYYGYGDTIMYYRSVLDMHRAIGDDLSFLTKIATTTQLDVYNPLYPYFMYDGSIATHYYMMQVNNFNVSRFALPYSLMFNGSYICISFCLSFFSFGGCWRIFKMFTELYPQLERKFAFSILFLPSILFWGGSLLKDSICLGAMGFALYAGYQIFFKKKKILASLLILAFSTLLLYYIKPYILLCLVPPFIFWRFYTFRKGIVDSGVRKFTSFALVIISIIGGALLLRQLNQSEIASQYASEKILETAQSLQTTFATLEEESGSSNYSVGAIGDSYFDLILMFPTGIITTYFRPFPWEVKNPLMLISAMEAFAFLYLTIMMFRKVGAKRVFSIGFNDSTVLFCLIFSFAFGGIIGITTTNFGALARYKIPCLPFYLFMIFIIMEKSGKISSRYIFGPRFF